MTSTAKTVVAVAGVAALAGIGIGLVPDQERSSVSDRTSSAQVTTVTPAAPFTSPTVESDDVSTTVGQPNEGIAIAPTGVPADAQQAVVRRIVDGDTLAVAGVTAGVALASTSTVDVRLLEINAPETKDPNTPVQCFGSEATAELTRLAPVGSTVWVQRDQELRDGTAATCCTCGIPEASSSTCLWCSPVMPRLSCTNPTTNTGR
ncbi:thermonuclease family protein [Nocardia sp. NPDC057663]|uniref:thermonuclease family protein n=1 Tax=Nocardia sp. NPDC057663 TaxID=3346201 RepID=UPI00366E53E6